MPVVTATQVTIYTDISCSAGTTTLALLIPIVQERINRITNNYFLTSMYLGQTVTFASAANSITGTSSYADEGFRAADEVYLAGSYRNDGYYIVSAVSTVAMVFTSAYTVTDEPSGKTVYAYVVDWPLELAYLAAQMIKYDYDDRSQKALGVTSRSLGPFSESYGSGGQSATPYGYPQELIDALMPYKYVRVD